MTEENVAIRTPDGTADAIMVRPEGDDRLPGVIVFTDIWGIRPAYVDLAKRIAEHGYAVLMPNIFYRSGKPPLFENMDAQNPATKARMSELTAPLTMYAMERDGIAYLDWLSAQPFAREAPVGAVGFCFSGKFALATAAASPDRVGAAASFHGVGLHTDTVDSPHLVLPRVKAHLYFGHATNDHSMNTEMIEKFEWALRSWGGDYASEIYNARHGWMIPGREMHDPENAERGFARMIELFADGLTGQAPVRSRSQARSAASEELRA